MEAYKYALCQSGCSGPINYYRKIFASDLPRGHTRTKIKAPTLVVWVGNISPQQAQRTRVLCLGPLTTPHAMHVYISLNRCQTQEHAQCTRIRLPAAKISRANFIETIAKPLLREKN